MKLKSTNLDIPSKLDAEYESHSNEINYQMIEMGFHLA